jgi:hypothetical protein
LLDELINFPVRRDSEGRAIYAAKISMPRIHAYSTDDDGMDQSPPVQEQWVIKRMSVEECAELIERHIAFVDKNGRLVHLPTRFVRHYLKR